MGSGGRYDGLVALVGGDGMPASGFALSLAEIVSHLGPADQPSLPSRRWLVEARADDASTLAEAFAAAQRLRALGDRAAIAVEGMTAAPSERLLAVERREGGFTYVLRNAKDADSTTYRTLDEALQAAKADAP
jgi:histidyl-tRNA synthetase